FRRVLFRSNHDIEHALDTEESPVRLFTLVGGLTGAATGFALATWTSMDWPLVTGGKPIISLPAWVIIAFELTILFGALSTVIGLFINARLRSEEHTSELQSRENLVCRPLLET